MPKAESACFPCGGESHVDSQHTAIVRQSEHTLGDELHAEQSGVGKVNRLPQEQRVQSKRRDTVGYSMINDTARQRVGETLSKQHAVT